MNGQTESGGRSDVDLSSSSRFGGSAELETKPRCSFSVRLSQLQPAHAMIIPPVGESRRKLPSPPARREKLRTQGGNEPKARS